MEVKLKKEKRTEKMTGSGKLVRLHHTNEPEALTIIIRNQIGKIYSIGRQQRQTKDGMEVIVCTSEFVSRHHCDVTYRNGAFWIKDNQSLNGTFLNGTRVAPHVDRELRFGDIVGLGVSHAATDVNVHSSEYFLFRFQAEIVPVIDLDDEEEEETPMGENVCVVNTPENRVGPSPPIAVVEPHQRPNVSIHQSQDSSSDVEIIDLDQDEKPTEDHNSNEAIARTKQPAPSKPSSSSPKKPLPPPPPPPSFSKKNDVSSRVGPASFKRKLAEMEQEKRKPLSPASSASINTSRQEKVDSSPRKNKQLQKKEREPAMKVPTEVEEQSENLKKRLKNDLKRKRPSVSSSDDDSDGIPHNEGKFVPNPDFNPDVDRLQEPMKKSKHSEPIEDDEEELWEAEDKPEVTRKPLSTQSLKDEILEGRRILRIILRKCVTEKGDAVQLRKKCASRLSPANRQKIFQQYHESKNRNILKSLPEVSDSDSSDSDSDIFEQVVVNKKSRKVIKRQDVTQRRYVEAESSDVSSYMDMDSYSDTDKRQSSKKKKRSSNERNLNKKKEQKRTTHKVENKTPTRTYPSTHYSPSNAEPQPGCSKDFYPSTVSKKKPNPISESTSASEDENMDYSDCEDNRSESEKVHDTTSRHDDSEEATKGRRTLKLLDHAPVPRQFRKLHEKSRPAISADSFYKQRSPPSKQLSVEEAKKARQEKLQQIEANKKAEDLQNKSQSVPKHAPAPVRAKVQFRNRNDQFLADLVNSAAKDHKEVEKAVPVKEVIKDIPAPRREIPLPAISPSKMPVNLITREMERSKLEHENRTRPAPPLPLTASRAPLPSRNVLEKEGSSLARATNPVETSHKTIINYYHGQAEPVTSVSAAKVTAVKPKEQEHFELPEDEAHLAISRWNPSWLREEQNSSTPPPLFSDEKTGMSYSLTRTRFNYDSYKSYLDVMFPLLMFEIWATIGAEYFETRKGDTPSHSSVSEEINEHSFVIEKVSKEQFCPMVSSRVPCKDHNWTTLSCYALEPPDKKFSLKKDLAIVTLNVEFPAKVGSSAVERRQKDYFGWIIYRSQKKSAIEGKINDDLKRETPNAKAKFNFKVVISTTHKILIHKLGVLKRVCYISPKLRDYKAMHCLRVSKLFPKIINLEPPSHPFDPNARVAPHYLIPYVTKLNPTQKSVVAYVSERVSSSGPEVMLLHGAPGVGKSRTIVAMILQILSKTGNQQNPRKILLCTPSNTAIDELMRRIDEALPELPNTLSIKMVRVGDTGGLCPKLKKYNADNIAKQKVHMSSTTANIHKELEQTMRELEDKKLEIEVQAKNKGSRTTIESLRRELLDIQKRKNDFQKDLETKAKAMKDGDLTRAKVKAIQEANIVCSTLTTCSNSMLSGEYGFSRANAKSFTCCIIDEATQATEPETLNPLLLQVDKLILVGDPCQLGATVLSSHAMEKGYDLSLFSRLHHYYSVQLKIPNAVMMLTQQYRMHPEILAWPNDAFYKGSLKTNIIGRSDSDACPLTPYIFLNLSGRESKVDGKISNELEIKLVLEVVRNIHLTTTAVNSSERRWSMGVITPYRDQKGKIKDAIKRELKAVADQVEVDTVDSFQGREKDVIIISCVRTDGTGFLNSKLRLNVALTRAKHSLIVIGDAECLRQESMWNDLIDNARTRGRIFDIQESSIRNSKHLTKRLFGALSPSRSVVNNDN